MEIKDDRSSANINIPAGTVHCCRGARSSDVVGKYKYKYKYRYNHKAPGPVPKSKHHLGLVLWGVCSDGNIQWMKNIKKVTNIPGNSKILPIQLQDNCINIILDGV